eukprot:622116-Pyramimonas_sp.AAC.1
MMTVLGTGGLRKRGRVVKPATHKQHVRKLQHALQGGLGVGEDNLPRGLQRRRRRRNPMRQLGRRISLV